MRSHELAQQLLGLPDAELLIQYDGEFCQGCSDPLVIAQRNPDGTPAPDVVLIGLYGAAGHLELAASPDEENRAKDFVYVQDVEMK